MKKRLIVLAAVLLFTLALCAPALAAGEALDKRLVRDDAALLIPEQQAELNARAAALSAQYSCDIAIVTTDSLGQLSAAEYAEAAFWEYGYGWGPERSCILLLLSMEYRDYDIMAYGFGNFAFTDYGKAVLEDQFLPGLRDDDWYAGFSAFIEHAAAFLDYARAGTPIDRDFDPYDVFTAKQALVTVLLSAIPALLLVLILASRMKTAIKEKAANEYIASHGVDITVEEDRFVRRTETRVKGGGSGGGRGGTSVNSGGFSHRGGKF